MTLSGFASEGVHLEVAGAADIRGTSRVPSQPRPLVSVIVPTYAARAPLLKSALASIWAQEGLGEQFEVEPIVVDNASSGPTDEVVRSFPGTRYVRFETNRGAGAARNAGLREATGTYVAFLDDDDLWMPHRLSVQVPVLEQAQEMEVGYSQFINVHRNGTWRMIPDPEGPSGWILDALFKALVAAIPTILVPKEAFDSVGVFDENLWRGQDEDMFVRLALRFPFRYIPGPVAVAVPSWEEWTAKSADDAARAWLVKRDKILGLVRGTPNEDEIRQYVAAGTWVHVVSPLVAGRRFDEARRALIEGLSECPMFEADAWYASRMMGLTTELALVSESHRARRAFLAEVEGTARRRGFRNRLRMRAFLADVWTRIALRHASGRQRDDRVARSAAARAIVENPLKPLSRPGLLRLLARAVAPVDAVGR